MQAAAKGESRLLSSGAATCVPTRRVVTAAVVSVGSMGSVRSLLTTFGVGECIAHLDGVRVVLRDDAVVTAPVGVAHPVPPVSVRMGTAGETAPQKLGQVGFVRELTLSKRPGRVWRFRVEARGPR